MTNKVFFFLYVNDSTSSYSKEVSQQDWEKSWLDWYNHVTKKD